MQTLQKVVLRSSTLHDAFYQRVAERSASSKVSKARTHINIAFGLTMFSFILSISSLEGKVACTSVVRGSPEASLSSQRSTTHQHNAPASGRLAVRIMTTFVIANHEKMVSNDSNFMLIWKFMSACNGHILRK